MAMTNGFYISTPLHLPLAIKIRCSGQNCYCPLLHRKFELCTLLRDEPKNFVIYLEQCGGCTCSDNFLERNGSCPPEVYAKQQQQCPTHFLFAWIKNIRLLSAQTEIMQRYICGRNRKWKIAFHLYCWIWGFLATQLSEMYTESIFDSMTAHFVRCSWSLMAVEYSNNLRLLSIRQAGISSWIGVVYIAQTWPNSIALSWKNCLVAQIYRLKIESNAGLREYHFVIRQ